MNTRVSIFLFIDFTQVQESEKQKLEIKFKNIFLSSMSHNLKTPLNSMIMNNELLLTQVKDKNSLAYDILQKDNQNMMILNYLVCDILDFSRLYSNEFHPHCTYFDLDVLLSRMRTLFLDQAE
jgi:K+-sensing histidine kinase KdpD